MAIEFPCPSCGHHLRAPFGSQGKTSKCPNCKVPVTIPEPHHTPTSAESSRRLEPSRDSLDDDVYGFADDDTAPASAQRSGMLNDPLLDEEDPLESQLKQAAKAYRDHTQFTGTAEQAIAAWVVLMALGDIDTARPYLREISRRSDESLELLREWNQLGLYPSGVPPIPTDVLQGFYKQLIKRLE